MENKTATGDNDWNCNIAGLPLPTPYTPYTRFCSETLNTVLGVPFTSKTKRVRISPPTGLVVELRAKGPSVPVYVTRELVLKQLHIYRTFYLLSTKFHFFGKMGFRRPSGICHPTGLWLMKVC